MPVVVAALLSTGCGGGPDVKSITVNPPNPTIKVGKTVKLSATARDANNQALPNAQIHWYSSDSAVATVTDTGTVTGVASGAAAITAYSGNVEGTTSVTVEEQVLYTVTVAFAGTGTGQVTSSPEGISCTASPCTASFAAGTQISVVGQGTNNSVFTGWSGACTGTDPCILTVGSNLNLTAHFASPFVLTVNVVGSGIVGSFPFGITCPTGPCAASYTAGSQVTLTATPNTGGGFLNWSGACSGSSNSCTVTLTSDLTVTANFLTLPVLSVTVVGSGKVSSSPAGISCSSGTCSATFPANASVTLNALPQAGYTFAGWSGGGCSGLGNCLLQMDSDKSVTANFVLTSSLPVLSVTIVGPGAGSVTSSPSGINCTSGTCTARYPNGTAVTLTASPIGSSTFGSWGGSCAGIPGNSCTLSMNGDLTVSATFAAGLTGGGGSTSSSQALRAPRPLSLSTGVAVEESGASALVAGPDRLDRIDLADLTVTKTIARGLSAPTGVVLERGGASALVTEGNNLTRINLTTGELTRLTTQLKGPTGLALDSSRNSALVADCGSQPCGHSGRLVRVALDTGDLTEVTPPDPGLDSPRAVAIEPGGETALVAEGTGQLLRVTLATGGAEVVARPAPSGLSSDLEAVTLEGNGTTALVTSPTDVIRVDLTTGAQTRSALLHTAAPALIGAASGSGRDALVLARTRASVEWIRVEQP